MPMVEAWFFSLSPLGQQGALFTWGTCIAEAGTKTPSLFYGWGVKMGKMRERLSAFIPQSKY